MEPKHILPGVGQMTLDEVRDFIVAVQHFAFCEGTHDNVNPEKELGADFIEAIVGLLAFYDLTPVQGAPFTGEEVQA